MLKGIDEEERGSSAGGQLGSVGLHRVRAPGSNNSSELVDDGAETAGVAGA